MKCMLASMAISALFYGAKADWLLIQRIQDIRDGGFTEDRIWNAGNEGFLQSNAMSIIGAIGEVQDDYRLAADSKFKLKLVYENADGSTSEMQWKQSSWIEEGTISGFESISGTHTAFKGLGLSSTRKATYLDFNGEESGNWWGSVGTIKTTYTQGDYTGIPGPLYKIAYSSTLFIWREEQDCGASTICDAVFMMDALQAAQREELDADIAAANDRIDAVEPQLSGLQDLVDGLADANARVDAIAAELGITAAHSVVARDFDSIDPRRFNGGEREYEYEAYREPPANAAFTSLEYLLLTTNLVSIVVALASCCCTAGLCSPSANLVKYARADFHADEEEDAQPMKR